MPKHPCSEPGCPNLATYRGKCKQHAHRGRHQARAEKMQVYNSKRWKNTRRRKLFIDPLCQRCGHIATDVHHKRGVESDPWSIDGLESLCHSCHSRVTRFEQVGEGPVAA